MTARPIPNEHIARALARNLNGIIGTDCDERFEHTFVNHVEPARWVARQLVGNQVRSEQSFELHLSANEASTLTDSLKEWAETERLEGDNCYFDDTLGRIDADKYVRLGELSDTLAVHLDRHRFDFETGGMKVSTNPVKLPATLDCAELSDVLETPSDVKYNLLACLVGTLRRETPDDNYVFWEAYVRVPGSDAWHRIDSIARCLKYTDAPTVSAEFMARVLDGETDLFSMKGWYQKADADVQMTTPSIAAWEESWREAAEHSVAMDTGGLQVQAAVGIPVADVIE